LLVVGLLVVGGDVGSGVGVDDAAISVGVGVEIIGTLGVNCGDGSNVLGEFEGSVVGL
jgi:hypothetical protein